MDDLVNLDWSNKSNSSSSKPPPSIPQKPTYLAGNPTQKPADKRDAFADLLNLSPSSQQKEPDRSKLSLAEQQRLGTTSSTASPMARATWQTHTSSSSPIHPSAASPVSTRSNYSAPRQASPSNSFTTLSPKPATVSARQQQQPSVTATSSTSSSSNGSHTSRPAGNLDSLLDPFGKKQRQPDTSSMPMHALRSQGTKSPEGYFRPNQGHHQWDLDFLDNSHAASTTDLPQQTESPSNKAALDPFDIDLLAQETRGATPHQAIPEMDDDNPLGILSGPALTRPAPTQDAGTFSSSPSASPPASPERRSSPAQRQSDLLLAQMVDMGFEMEEAKVALEATGGEDLQSAVDLIVHNAAALREQRSPQRPSERRPERYQDEMDDASDTARARMALFSDEPQPPRRKPAVATDRAESPQSESADKQQQQINFQQHKEKIVAQASELGGFLYKNASMFVKTGRQRINKAVEDWQEQQRAEQLHRQQGRPRWMTEAVEDDPDLQAVREQQMREQQQRRQQRQQQRLGRTSDETTSSSPAPSLPQQQQQTRQTQGTPEPFVEKFVDDDSSDEDPELEKRREMEWKQLQEAKRREYIMQKRRQQEEQARARQHKQMLEEQDVYVSPSRRRAAPSTRSSNASTSRSGTPAQPRSATPASSRPPASVQQERQRPVVEANPDVLARANAARQQGNDQFKLGQFGDAEAAYTRAIDILPSGHDHLAVLSNNRAAALLKMGEYKRSIADCVLAADLARNACGEGQCESGGITIVWRDQLVKALSRHAEACEHLEKYHDAIQVYEELMKVDMRNPKVNQGLARCRQAIQPKKKAPAPKVKKQQQQSSQNAGSAFPTVDYSVFETKPKGVENSKAVAAMRAQAAQQEAEEAERLSRTDDVNARIVNWKAGKEHNLRALLATLDTLLWPGAQWRGANISELIDPKKCKITYLKAISKVHPDKLPASTTVEQRMLASAIFSTLNEAWDAFKSQT
ncbi:hypothetical protein BCR43DRAFT_484136 [Syncephalastrum racemosum]|uniref:UBA domain-containing protein n=1 Tax=Syncephalastrum racemosum TaxID=13706 RepID=A0A1X2HWD1_SYNRA|nr:hypothetical protein BCR43DRAFT_484136 [Syncephalastrum racemosum]